MKEENKNYKIYYQDEEGRDNEHGQWRVEWQNCLFHNKTFKCFLSRGVVKSLLPTAAVRVVTGLSCR